MLYSYRPSQGNTTFTPNGRAFTALAAMYTIGVATLFVLALATLTCAVYVCSLLVESVCQLASHIAASYNHADSFTQLLFIGFVLYLSYRLILVARSHRLTFSK